MSEPTRLRLVHRNYADEVRPSKPPVPPPTFEGTPLVDDFHVEAVLAEADELLLEGRSPGIAWFVVSNRELARLSAWTRVVQQRAGNPNGTLADRIEMMRRVVTFAAATMRFVGAHPGAFVAPTDDVDDQERP